VVLPVAPYWVTSGIKDIEPILDKADGQKFQPDSCLPGRIGKQVAESNYFLSKSVGGAGRVTFINVPG
jgi:hypothetical protein